MKQHTFRGRKYHLVLDGVVQGYADDPTNKDLSLYIASNLGPKKYLEISVHEAIHACFPDMAENEVKSSASDIGRFLWRLGYRRG